MARTFGNPGNFAMKEANRRVNRLISLIIIATVGGSYALGLYHGLSVGKHPHAFLVAEVFLLLAGIFYLARRYLEREGNKYLEAARAFRKGAEGEGLTADSLSDLPDTYAVFHDLTHPSIGGNIDHIVVGPSGVFALETKNWRGMVTLSGKGTLTVDGQRDQTKDGKAILGRALDLKKKIEALSNISTFVQAVMVFPKASVSVMPETRCALTVLRLDLLEAHLTRPSSHPLTAQQVDTITHDLQALFKP